MPPPRSPLTFAIQRAVLRTGETRLRAFWLRVYRVCARVFVLCLLWREPRATAYMEPQDDDFLPGLSDVDLVIVLPDGREPPDAAALRIRQRAGHMRGRKLLQQFPIIDDLRVYEDSALGDLVGSTALTYRLDGAGPSPQAYVGDAANADPVRLLTRPGLYGSVESWRRLSGPERRPPERPRDAQEQRIAAWLELGFWWRLLPRACIDAVGPRPADLCIKSVAEAVRIWALLARGERIPGRAQALRRGLELLPGEEAGLRRTLELRRSLSRWPDSPLVLDDTLPVLVRLSSAIAALIDADAQAAGFTEVRLAGADPLDAVLAGGAWRPNAALPGGRAPDVLPLTDWRGLACPLAPDDAFAPLTADPTDSASYLTAASLNDGPYPTLLADRLLIRPGFRFVRTRLRAIECRTTDPVSFALLERRRTAAFPNLRGWSVADTAARAVAEHRRWLRPARAEPGGLVGHELGMLLSAARAGVLDERVRDGRPELPLTLAEGVRMLAARSSTAGAIADEALGHYRAFVDGGPAPPPETLTAMRELVGQLPAYAPSERSRSLSRSHSAWFS